MPASGSATPRLRISTAQSIDPSRISIAVRLTSDCGVLPPAVVYAVSRGMDAEPSRDQSRRVAVAPRQQLHDTQRLGVGEDVRRAGVGCRGPHCLDDEVDRAEGVVEAFGPMQVLADADDDGAAGIRSHGSDDTRRYTRRVPWPSERDDELFSVIDQEVERQNTTLQLIASENFASPAVLAANGSVLNNKYSEGYPGKRYYGGNRFIDEAEDLARERVKALFGAEAANVQPHSGANANIAAYLALLEPGDTVMGLRLDQGGHLTHGSPVNASGKLFRFVAYGLTPSDERIDLDQVRDLALAERPKMIIAGATAYPRIIDAEPFREIADEVGALFLFDAAHIAGLIAGGAHPSPDSILRRRDLHHAQDAARPAVAASCRRPSTAPPSTRRCSRGSRVVRSNMSSRRRQSPSTKRRIRRSRTMPRRS